MSALIVRHSNGHVSLHIDRFRFLSLVLDVFCIQLLLNYCHHLSGPIALSLLLSLLGQLNLIVDLLLSELSLHGFCLLLLVTLLLFDLKWVCVVGQARPKPGLLKHF